MFTEAAAGRQPPASAEGLLSQDVERRPLLSCQHALPRPRTALMHRGGRWFGLVVGPRLPRSSDSVSRSTGAPRRKRARPVTTTMMVGSGRAPELERETSRERERGQDAGGRPALLRPRRGMLHDILFYLLFYFCVFSVFFLFIIFFLFLYYVSLFFPFICSFKKETYLFCS